jgi:hypothetical protein
VRELEPEKSIHTKIKEFLMWEVIISTVSTGKVYRRSFDSTEKADRYTENFLRQRLSQGSSARNYRVEKRLCFVESTPSPQIQKDHIDRVAA